MHSMDEMPNPCGMANLGNTCFLNSCIQILNNVREIKDAWLPSSSNHSADHLVFSDWIELRAAMKGIVGKMSHPVINPSKFVKTIQTSAKMKNRELFTGWAQNDLSEFLLFMMDCMHNVKKRSVKMSINGTTENSTDHLALKCYKMLKENYEMGDYSELSDIFYGVYVSVLSSPDGNIVHSLKPEQYSILDLPIHGKSPNLHDCFDEFVRREELSGWLNEKTGNKESVQKSIVFWNFPRILVILLKRFSPDGRLKNKVLVDFPVDSILDLSKYAVGYKASKNKYKLFGVANHMGGVDGGHYTAFALCPEDNHWYQYNDTIVQRVEDLRQILSPYAYCLFYRKI